MIVFGTGVAQVSLNGGANYVILCSVTDVNCWFLLKMDTNTVTAPWCSWPQTALAFSKLEGACSCKTWSCSTGTSAEDLSPLPGPMLKTLGWSAGARSLWLRANDLQPSPFLLRFPLFGCWPFLLQLDRDSLSRTPSSLCSHCLPPCPKLPHYCPCC